ncbi:glycoside hydrolase family 16 protein [Rossellomorea marisflavi]|uniref:Glycoside hydrolase family 16 protein n=1 Tax=Rossellomorea marisflavi TaxID=189381 RepID=A0A5D4S4T6_9BACI|nr:glycoside hydrolase family 16 protein [Rossellomorea marisflavi]
MKVLIGFLFLCLILTLSSDVTSKDHAEIQADESFPFKLRDLSPRSQSQDDWTLIFEEEFSGDSWREKWSIQDWPSDKNEELQYYTPDNVTARNGYLVLSSKSERFKGRDYTSGAVTTEDLFEFTYGKLEIRAKLPSSKGVFPALWLVNSESEDWLPEIDVMENIGQEPNNLYFVVHWRDGKGVQKRDYLTYTGEEAFHEHFHTYGMIWDEDKISWTLDGQVVFETTAFSPDVPLFLYMNTAIGGIWPGDPEPGNVNEEFLIDYVRVYQDRGEE